MSITIPNDKNKPAKPIISLTGTKYVDGTTTTLAAEAQTSYIVQDGNDFTRQNPIKMVGTVTVTLADGEAGTLASYNTDHEFVGSRNIGSDETVGDDREIFYTLNGKDPKRTKNYVYKGAFEILENKTGSDNTIIKARTYYAGVWSDVEQIELNIIAE